MSCRSHRYPESMCRIAFAGAASPWPHEELFRTMQRLIPVRFVAGFGAKGEWGGEIRFANRSSADLAAATETICSFSVPPVDDAADARRDRRIDVVFADDAEVPLPFRGRTVATRVTACEPLLALGADESVLATCQQGPVWSMRRAGRVKHFRSGLPLPSFTPTDNFNDVFNGEHFLELLPLLHFLREIGEHRAYQHAPLRAAYIIDDPNLHWPRYGFVDYARIALHAQRENYHVCFATIPIDSWFTHAGTARLFRQNSRWLSLSVHGNNHAKNELARAYTQSDREALFRQAIHRIESLERKAGLHVCRVMVPPHGACSSQMLGDLPKFGFEAACVSPGSLNAHNQGEAWTRTLGYFPAEVINGCAVLPRSGLRGSVENTLLVAAYLGRPMILMGHHGDFRNGMEAFDGLAGFIHGLGRVSWTNLTELSRANYLWRADGSTVDVRPFGGTIAIPLRTGTTDVCIDPPDAEDGDVWQVRSGDSILGTAAPGDRVPVAAGPERRIVLKRILRATDIPPKGARLRRVGARLVLRRLLTETRDRMRI